MGFFLKSVVKKNTIPIPKNAPEKPSILSLSSFWISFNNCIRIDDNINKPESKNHFPFVIIYAVGSLYSALQNGDFNALTLTIIAN